MPFKENQHSRNLLLEVSEIEFIRIKIQIFQCHLFIIHKNAAQRAIKILISEVGGEKTNANFHQALRS